MSQQYAQKYFKHVSQNNNQMQATGITKAHILFNLKEIRQHNSCNLIKPKNNNLHEYLYKNISMIIQYLKTYIKACRLSF